MKVISLGCNKGGVGRTSCQMQISGIMSYIGQRVLLADCDGQGNLSKRLKLQDSEYFIQDLLLGRCNIEDVLKQPYPDDEKLSNIWVIPSSFGLSTIEKEDPEFNDKQAYILSQAFKDIEDSFDICFLDTNPNPALTTNIMAYCYSDYFIGIVDMCDDSAIGLNTLIETQIKPIQEYVKPDLEILGVIFNNYDGRSTYAKNYLSSIQELYGNLMFKSIITNSSIIPQSSAVMIPLIVLEPSSKLTTQFVELSSEILRRINKVGVLNVK